MLRRAMHFLPALIAPELIASSQRFPTNSNQNTCLLPRESMCTSTDCCMATHHWSQRFEHLLSGSTSFAHFDHFATASHPVCGSPTPLLTMSAWATMAHCLEIRKRCPWHQEIAGHTILALSPLVCPNASMTLLWFPRTCPM